MRSRSVATVPTCRPSWKTRLRLSTTTRPPTISTASRTSESSSRTSRTERRQGQVGELSALDVGREVEQLARAVAQHA